MTKPYLRVAVGVILDQNKRVLLAQRPEDKPWAGWWEFPGGKIEQGENVHEALARELKEELNITIQDSFPWVSFTYEYPKTIVELHFRKVYQWQGEIKGLEKQVFSWTSPEEAHTLGELLPASIAPLKWLSFPDYYAITHFDSPDKAHLYWEKLERLLAKGVKLFQFREPQWQEGVGSNSLRSLFEQMLQRCHAQGATLLVNSCHPKSWWEKADGVQLRSEDAVQCEKRPLSQEKIVSISCHHLADILYANLLGADFIVLGHVLNTASHPNTPPIGWQQFSKWASEANHPVYAIGGQNRQTLEEAKQYGAHGIAMLSSE